MKQRNNRVMVGIVIAIILTAGVFDRGISVVYSEGLSDAQLYGDDKENVLGHTSSSANKQSASKGNTDQVQEREKQQDTTRADTLSEQAPDEEVENESETQSDTEAETSGATQSDTISEEDSASQSDDIVNNSGALQSNSVSSEGDASLIPTINLDGIEDGGYYSDTVQVGIQVLNVDDTRQKVTTCLSYSDVSGNAKQKTIGVRREGTIIWGTEEVEDEGEYELSVEVGAVSDSDMLTAQTTEEDLEQTFAHKQIAFEIDKTPPIVDLSDYTQGVLQEIDVKQLREQTVFDRTPVDTKVTVNGQEVSDLVISDEGAYEVTVDAVDAAGNQTSQSGLMTIQTTSGGGKTSGRTMGCGVGAVLFAGSILLYRERKKLKKEEEVNDKK